MAAPGAKDRTTTREGYKPHDTNSHPVAMCRGCTSVAWLLLLFACLPLGIALPAGCNATVQEVLLRSEAVLNPSKDVLNWSSQASTCFCQWKNAPFVCSDDGSLDEIDFTNWKLNRKHYLGLRGMLPAEWSKLTGIWKLWITNGNVSGTLPKEWSTLTSLRTLSIVGNSNLTGTLPPEWSTLTKLGVMSIEDNNLTGQLPSAWSNMKVLYDMDLSNNSFYGEIPQSWSALSYLAAWYLHGNSNLCNSTTCLNSIASAVRAGGMSQLGAVSITGGLPIPQDWCSNDSPDVGLRYVGALPNLDSCSLEKLCVLLNPPKIVVSYPVQGYNTMVLNEMYTIGTASSNDLCIDPGAVRIGIALIGISGTAVLAMVGHGIWVLRKGAKASTPGDAAACCPQLRQVKATRAGAVLLALFSLKPLVSSVIDIATDIILVYSLLPFFSGYLVLLAVFASDFLSSRVFYWHIVASVQSARVAADGATIGHGSAIPSTGWGGLLVKLCEITTPLWLMPVRIVVVYPLLSLVIHVQSGAMAVDRIFRACKGQSVSDYKWAYLGCLDVAKCVDLQSLMMAAIEDPLSITFSTLAYMLPAKKYVGKFLNAQYFLLNISTSMIHILMEVWRVKEVVVREKSWPASKKCLMDVAVSHDTVQPAVEAAEVASSQQQQEDMELSLVGSVDIATQTGWADQSRGKLG